METINKLKKEDKKMGQCDLCDKYFSLEELECVRVVSGGCEDYLSICKECVEDNKY